MKRRIRRRATAKQIAWRKKFASLYGGKKRLASNRVRYTRKKHRSVDDMPRKRHHGRKGSSSFGLGGLNIMDLVLMGAGAGFAGVVGQQVTKYSNNALTGNTAQAAAGIGLYFIGKKMKFGKYSTPIAKGILIKTIGDLVEENVAPMISGSSSAGTGNGGYI